MSDPVSPHSDEQPANDEVRAAAFTAARACSRPEDIYKQLDTIIAAVRPLIEAAARADQRQRLVEDINTNVAEAFYARAEQIRADERNRIADAIDAEAVAPESYAAGCAYEHAARIARGETP